ncbi:hypothetical protein NPIL_177341 [Nephila pilipes]|uniref:Uncharacterized protein n=1 Tax=Nephila pilipes TaxID=299642 RepID=A0A8X6U5H8_NEPPI|nr:hypothetical protein NPIL_177341 [Nephila pilipes]
MQENIEKVLYTDTDVENCARIFLLQKNLNYQNVRQADMKDLITNEESNQNFRNASIWKELDKERVRMKQEVKKTGHELTSLVPCIIKNFIHSINQKLNKLRKRVAEIIIISPPNLVIKNSKQENSNQDHFSVAFIQACVQNA